MKALSNVNQIRGSGRSLSLNTMMSDAMAFFPGMAQLTAKAEKKTAGAAECWNVMNAG